MNAWSRRAIRSAVLLAAVLGGLCPRPAQSAATLRATADASASASDDFSDSQTPPTSDSGPIPIVSLPASASATLGASARARYAQATSSSYGEVLLGVPGSFSGALAFATGSAWAFAPGGGSNPQNSSASSRAEIAYDDVLTAGGLPPGTPVTLRVRLDLNGQINHQGSNRHASVQLTFGDPGSSTPLTQIIDDDQDGAFAESATVQVVVLSGTPRPFELKLLQEVSGSASSPGDGLGSASTDFRFAPHRGRLSIDALTAGATYVLDSGADLRSAPGTSVPVRADAVALALSAPRPNPARGPVDVELTIPVGGARGHWSVIDLAGRAVWRSAERRWPAGVTLLEWSGADSRGRQTPAGVYLLQFESDRGRMTRRIVRVP
ncbi:MAG: T9SS type A sorting domain-containing protein [bacterium]